MLNTAVLLIIFNRPDSALQVVQSIRKVKPKKLYIAADGPRPHIMGEDLLCKETRKKVLDEIDWRCEVITLFRKTNRGCGLGPAEAISWFFEQEEHGIILEDDCIPNESFFTFCEELLRKYHHDTRIMQVSGTNFHKGWRNNSSYSYYFSEIGICWGWATWRRAWKLFDFNMKLYEEAENKGYIDCFPFFRHGKQNYIYQMIQKLKQSGELDAWDIQWNFAQYINSGLSITPIENLIKNIGFGENATHTKSMDDRYLNELSAEVTFPLQHPPFIFKDIRSDERYLKNFYRWRLVDRIKNKINKTLAIK